MIRLAWSACSWRSRSASGRHGTDAAFAGPCEQLDRISEVVASTRQPAAGRPASSRARLRCLPDHVAAAAPRHPPGGRLRARRPARRGAHPGPLEEVRVLATQLDVRLSFHPDQFVVLGTPHPTRCAAPSPSWSCRGSWRSGPGADMINLPGAASTATAGDAGPFPSWFRAVVRPCALPADAGERRPQLVRHRSAAARPRSRAPAGLRRAPPPLPARRLSVEEATAAGRGRAGSSEQHRSTCTSPPADGWAARTPAPTPISSIPRLPTLLAGAGRADRSHGGRRSQGEGAGGRTAAGGAGAGRRGGGDLVDRARGVGSAPDRLRPGPTPVRSDHPHPGIGQREVVQGDRQLAPTFVSTIVPPGPITSKRTAPCCGSTAMLSRDPERSQRASSSPVEA